MIPKVGVESNGSVGTSFFLSRLVNPVLVISELRLNFDRDPGMSQGPQIRGMLKHFFVR